MKYTDNLSLLLYDPNDTFYITSANNSLNSNFKIIDKAISDLEVGNANSDSFTKQEINDKLAVLKGLVDAKFGYAVKDGTSLKLYSDSSMANLLQTITLSTASGGSNTTYTFSISGNVLTILDSNGVRQTITLPTGSGDSYDHTALERAVSGISEAPTSNITTSRSTKLVTEKGVVDYVDSKTNDIPSDTHINNLIDAKAYSKTEIDTKETALTNSKVGYAEVSDGMLKMYSNNTKSILVASVVLPSGGSGTGSSGSGLTESQIRTIIESYNYITTDSNTTYTFRVDGNKLYINPSNASEYSVDLPTSTESVTKEELSDIVNQYFKENPVTGVTPEVIASAVESYLAEHPVQGDGNTTYAVSLDGNVLTLTGSDGSTQTITLPSGGTVSFPEGGSVGQVLKKTSDGVTWADDEAGNVSDEQIASSVNDWLDAHPEATTTVQNGSVTKEKLGKDVTNVVYGYDPNWKYEPDDSVTEDLEVYVATSSNTPWEKASTQNQNASYTLAAKFTGIPKKIRAVLDGGTSDTQMSSVNLFFSYDNDNWELFGYSDVGYRGYTEGVMDGRPYCYAGLEPFSKKDKQVDETVFWNWDGLNRESLQKLGKTEQPNYWCLTWNSPNSTLAKFKNGTCHLYAIYFSPNPNKWGNLNDEEDVEILAVFPSLFSAGSAAANKTLFAVVPAYKGETYKWSAGNTGVWDTVDGVRTLRYLPYLIATNEEDVLTKRFPLLYGGSNVAQYSLNGNTAFMPCDWIEGHEYRNSFGAFAQFTVPEDFPYNYLLIPYASGSTITNYNQPTVIDDNRSKEDYEEYLEKQGSYGWLQKAFITVRDWVLKDLPSNEYILERVDPHAERKDQGTLFAQLSVNNPLHNANVVMFGDSLTDAYGGHVWNDNSAEKGFMTKIAQEFGVYFDNRAKSGTNFQRTSGGVYANLDGCDQVDRYVADDTHESPDYCLFMFGANCWGSQIGDITSTDDKKLYGAVKYCIDAIRNAYPNCIVAVILQYPVADWQNGQKTPHAAHEAIKELITSAEYDYRVPYLDLYQYNIRSVDLRDGVHPAATGVNKLHHAIRGFLMTL